MAPKKLNAASVLKKADKLISTHKAKSKKSSKSKKMSRPKSKSPSKTKTKSKSKSKSKSKLSRELSPGMIAFQEISKHVASTLGRGGAVAMKIAGYYKKEAESAGKTGSAAAIKLFDADSSNHTKMLKWAEKELEEGRAAKKAKKSLA